MLKKLPPFLPTVPTAATPVPVPRVAEPDGALPAAPDRSLLDAAVRVAPDLYPRRDIEVTTRIDEPTGRTVVRIADRASGQVLTQTPPEDLLRFYAAARETAERNASSLVATLA